MNSYEYHNFCLWLNEEYSLKENELTSRYKEYIFQFNQYIHKHLSCEKSLFDLIREENFKYIVLMRTSWAYQKNQKTIQERDFVIRLVFKYLGKDYSTVFNIENPLAEISETKNTLYIYSGFIRCIRFRHDIKDITAVIPAVGKANAGSIKVHASYCTECGLMFITKAYYKQLKKLYPIMISKFCELDETGNPCKTTMNGNAESILKMCGYSVGKNGPSTDMRRFILKSILEKGFLIKTDIITYLEHFLMFNASKEGMYDASEKWKADLEYIRNLNFELQPEMLVSDIQLYR